MVENGIKKYVGRVYAIRSPSTENVYIGSTTQPLSKRMSQHRDKFNYMIGSGDMSKWCQSFYVLDSLDAYIELISEHENISKDELKKFEGMAIREEPNCVNKNVAGQKYSDWVESGFIKNYMKDYNKTDKAKLAKQKWYLDNKEHLKEYQKQYRLKQKSKS